VENVLSACILVENVHHSNGFLHNLCDGVEFIFFFQLILRIVSIQSKEKVRNKPRGVRSATVQARVEVIFPGGTIFHKKNVEHVDSF
jgi:hypothetical protein